VAPPYPEYIHAIVEGGVRIVETAGRNPAQYIPALKAHGVKVIHKCTSVRHSLTAERIGCDALSVDGFECGGHPGEDDIPNMIPLPRVAEELKIPSVASGSMADGRSLVAALALGADGINMGTRFIATKEAPVHDNVKQALVTANELQTRLIMRPSRNTERVLTNAAVEQILAIERDKGADTKIEDIRHLVGGAGNRRVLQDGELDAGAWSCGMVAGLIHDIPTCKELIDRIMAEAEAIIRSRLEGLLAARDRPSGEERRGIVSDLIENIENGIATLTFNRPERLNALSTPIMQGTAGRPAATGRRPGGQSGDPDRRRPRLLRRRRCEGHGRRRRRAPQRGRGDNAFALANGSVAHPARVAKADDCDD
jgi:nitronate monooxygenase